MTNKAISFELKRTIPVFCQGNTLERTCARAHSQIIEHMNPTSQHGELERTKYGLERTKYSALVRNRIGIERILRHRNAKLQQKCR
jgi:hypothetical protein